MAIKNSIFKILIISVLAFWPLTAGYTSSTSTNFILRDNAVDIASGQSSSTNFVQINAAGQTATGESTSTNFILRAGILYFSKFTPKSQNWRWYDDEANETPVTALAAENTAPSGVVDGNILKLRLTVKETGGAKGKNTKFKLQFSEFSDFSAGVNTVVEQSNCLGNSFWCYADGAGLDNAVITTKTLSDADACAASIGNGCGTHNESATSTSIFTHQKNAATEYEFTLKPSGATSSLIYFFRAFDATNNRAVPLNIGENYPSISVGGTTLTFSVSGVPNATSTEGITTTTATTATEIPYGVVPIDLERAAAQRLSISTNAAQGYQIFILTDQDLTGPNTIPAVGGTNETPAAWTIAPNTAGAFGYHAGDDTLAGNSARFAPNDTYAKLETAPKEIVFSSIPVTNESTDIVFKLQITDQQDAGAYQSAITYIMVPTF